MSLCTLVFCKCRIYVDLVSFDRNINDSGVFRCRRPCNPTQHPLTDPRFIPCYKIVLLKISIRTSILMLLYFTFSGDICVLIYVYNFIVSLSELCTDLYARALDYLFFP